MVMSNGIRTVFCGRTNKKLLGASLVLYTNTGGGLATVNVRFAQAGTVSLGAFPAWAKGISRTVVV
jgi:hypothetical protein